MAQITRETIKELVLYRHPACLSVYMPTYRSGADVQQNVIRFRNALSEAERALREAGADWRDTAATLDAVRSIESAFPIFWEHQYEGLAVFASPDMLKHYRVAMRLPELVVAGGRFHLKPARGVLSRDQRFYVLSLGLNGVRLDEGTRDGLEDIELDGMPVGIQDVIGPDAPETALQYHTGVPSAGRGGSAIYHGQGTGVDDRKDRLVRYLRLVDVGLRGVLANDLAPVVVAGVDDMLPLYRAVSAHPRSMPTGVHGSPDALSVGELHGRAWEIVQPLLQQERDAAAERFHELQGTGLASANVVDTVPTAFDGRVDTLFVAVGVQPCGSYSPDTHTVELHSERQFGDWDLLDLAAAECYINGGTVFAVPPADVPGGGHVATVFRY